MGQWLSTIIVAVITGVVSIITVIIQKRQDKVIKRIDEQTLFIEKEKAIKQRLQQKEKERDGIIHEIMILILDTNLKILKNTQVDGAMLIDGDVFDLCDTLKGKFEDVSKTIEELNKEYAVVLDMTSELQRQIEGSHHR